MSDERRLEQMFRYCLFAIAMLHLVCFALNFYISRQPHVQAMTHFASVAPAAPSTSPSA